MSLRSTTLATQVLFARKPKGGRRGPELRESPILDLAHPFFGYAEYLAYLDERER